MYCSNCGKEIEKKDNFCKYCGHKINNKEEVNNVEVVKTSKKEEPGNGLKTSSIVLGIVALVGNALIVFSFASIVLSIIGLILAICSNKEAKNIAGIVLNSISIFLSIILISLIVRFIKFVPRIINNGLDAGSSIIEKYNRDNNYDFGDFFDDFYSGDFDLRDFFNGFDWDTYLPENSVERDPNANF